MGKIIDSLRELLYIATFKKVDRRELCTFYIKPSEELPLEAWTYLVKRRASFKCEDCETNEAHSRRLEAHHIIRPEDGGKNMLRNGKCLCSQCHGKAHTIVIPKKKGFRTIMQAIGKRKYAPYMKEIREEIRLKIEKRKEEK